MSRNPRAFMEIRRVPMPEREPAERVRDYGEIYGVLPTDELRLQGARCMDCGVPFCNSACPLGNLIPDWNDLVRRNDWKAACDQLHATNNFPEFTGLVCPAPCESACVLAIDDDPVMIKQIEYAIVHRGFEEGWIVARPPQRRTGHTVAVIGSGPAGLAAAQELNQVGHEVTVYERDETPGGLMRFGVPDAKLEKWMIDRRVKLLEEEGVKFEYNAEVGGNVDAKQLAADNDAVIVAIGSRVERDFEAPGRDLDGVHFAMDYLYQRNRFVARSEGREAPEPDIPIVAEGKHVVVIGGGDTGMDCISNANREGALSATLLDVYPEVPSDGRYPDTPWPLAPKRSFTTYALDEGGERKFGHQVIGLEGTDGKVSKLIGRRVTGSSSSTLEPVPDSEFEMPADLVLIAIGFLHPAHDDVVSALGIGTNKRGNVDAKHFATSVDGVYAAGDARIGQSLIVSAIAEGRRCARAVDRHLRATG